MLSFGSKANPVGAPRTVSVPPLEVDIAFDADQGYLSVRTAGTIDGLSLPGLLTASAAAAQKHQCYRFFVDHRASGLRLNATEIYNVPASLERHGIVGHRAAVLFSKIGDDERFLELVCANRGIFAKVFTHPNEALAWLLLEP